MGSDEYFPPREFSFSDLELFTNGFSEANFIGNTQFGKVYRGKIPDQDGVEVQEVTVKIWVDLERFGPAKQRFRARDETYVIRDAKLNFHPNLMKFLGYCVNGEHVGIVYDLKPLDTVYNLIFEESFTWLRRIKVAMEFARLLVFCHSRRRFFPQILVRNISPAHIMLDQDFSPRLLDFGMISGGILNDKKNHKGETLFGCQGYSDPCFAKPGGWSEKCDVFSYGCVLIGLVAKVVYNEKDSSINDASYSDVYEWAREAYNPKKFICGFGQSKCSLVHESLLADQDFCSSDGRKITKLMIRCVDEHPDNRPTMKEVVESLLKMRVVRRNLDALFAPQNFPPGPFPEKS